MGNNTWTCEACHKEFTKGRDNWKDAINKPDPNNFMAQTPLIYICEDCGKRGFLFQYGELRIYPDSPADNPANQQPRATGDTASFNPFHDMSTWPKGSGKAEKSRGYAIKNYYKKKRR